jgi:hypothetical protein
MFGINWIKEKLVRPGSAQVRSIRLSSSRFFTSLISEIADNIGVTAVWLE